MPSALEVGLVVRDIETMLPFYRDFLALPIERELEFPGIRLWCLSTGAGVVKLVSQEQGPDDANPPGGLYAATGLRYLTLEVDDPLEMAARAETAGGKVHSQAEMSELTFAIVEDPEGNHVELLRWAC